MPSNDAYSVEYRGILIDPYRILKEYGINDPALQHAIKKLLRLGRGERKDIVQDIREARESLDRFLQMLEEDEQTPMEKRYVPHAPGIYFDEKVK